MSMALIAQFISLIISILMSFMVSRRMDVASYGYWQLFIFFMAYFPITAIGLLDGIYLSELGKDYENLNFSLVGSQFKILVFQQILVAVLIIGTVRTGQDENRIFALSMAAIYMVLFNVSYFIGYVFQATNNVWVFSLAIILDKGIFAIILALFLIKKVSDFRIYILAYTFSKLISLGYCLLKGKRIVCSSKYKLEISLREVKKNINCGAKVTIGNLAGMFIIGCGRMVVDWHWGIEAFSVFSFAITLVNFFLTFIGQISMVILPALKRVDQRDQKQNFEKLRTILPILLLGVMVFYVPGKQILSIWLPAYSQSFIYMAILLPICIFDGKMQLVNNVYLKMLRKEDMILKINLVCVALAAIASLISAIVFNSTEMVMIAVVVIVGIRSVYTEMYLEKQLGIPHSSMVFWEVIVSLVFMLLNLLCPVWEAFVGYAVCYMVYIIVNLKKIKAYLPARMRA